MLQIIIDWKDRQKYRALKMALGVQTSVISPAKVCNHCNYKAANQLLTRVIVICLFVYLFIFLYTSTAVRLCLCFCPFSGLLFFGLNK